jgi:hypothetical protein
MPKMYNSITLKSTVPYIYSKLSPAKPTIVFDSYWKFAAERQNVFFKRYFKKPWPWTKDPVIAKYKFTNVYRIADRVSQYLVKEVIYNEKFSSDITEVFFRIMIFKLFNKIETWEKLLTEIGEIRYKNFKVSIYDKILSRISQTGQAIYSAAYIMPSGKSFFGHDKKHTNHLWLIEKMMRESLPQKIEESGTMQRGFELFRSYPSIGDFLAYQYITDINYSEITDFSETEFVIPGPGAKSGISKCFSDLGGLSQVEIIKLMMDRQEIEFDRLDLKFERIVNRPLQLIDCQNVFCETDKYARIMHPNIKGSSDRMRIKQVFVSHGDPGQLYLPPKWGFDKTS